LPAQLKVWLLGGHPNQPEPSQEHKAPWGMALVVGLDPEDSLGGIGNPHPGAAPPGGIHARALRVYYILWMPMVFYLDLASYWR